MKSPTPIPPDKIKPGKVRLTKDDPMFLRMMTSTTGSITHMSVDGELEPVPATPRKSERN